MAVRSKLGPPAGALAAAGRHRSRHGAAATCCS
eukprot:CAMPEP_0204349102 /NCGR_PEP_ID=MMETSP0469-20131031/29251_1 /ASSEMBLY_ACC=CAM_ASM_000384 /TAXON_ID=2969 /ORGANISM="Oxyrrhis marina" /LENGTH=32 /DNA_ID= /DNA_START= /DNA_END= /DNA_ORIENTATION=